MKGSYLELTPIKDASMCFLSEGYATACTIQEAFPNVPSVVAFNAGNLKNVVQYLKKLNSGLRIVICADKDPSGVSEAKAKECGIEYILPQALVGTDFNDLGVIKTREQLGNLFEKIELIEDEPKKQEINYKEMELPHMLGLNQVLFKMIYGSSHVPRTRISWASAITTMGSILSNKVFVDNNITTHLYSIDILYRDWETDRKSTRLNSSH